MALGPAARVRLLYPHLLRSSRLDIPAYPRSIQRYMVEAETSNCPARAAAICAGESPRATSDLMAAIIDSNSRSSRSTPARAADSSSSAIAWALAAEYSTRQRFEQW